MIHEKISERPAPARLLRILVADDEPAIALALKRVLECRGHTVSTAFDAKEAVALLRGSRYDAALVDARMPGSGFTVLDHIAGDPEFTGPVVLMTGALSTDPSFKVGPEVHRLQKPFRFPDVLPLVEGSFRS